MLRVQHSRSVLLSRLTGPSLWLLLVVFAFELHGSDCGRGFRGKALVTDIRFAATGPWKGFIGTLRPSRLPRGELPPIPRGMGALAVGSFGGGKIDEMNPPPQGSDT